MTIPNKVSPEEIRRREQAVLSQEVADDVQTTADMPQPVPGKPLPDGYVNLPCGQIGHKCLDPNGLYQPTWMQMRLARFHDNQRNPQSVGCADQTYHVPLDVWVDVPPEVVHTLGDAIETHHEQVMSKEHLLVGQRPMMVTSSRPRFMYQVINSA